jgi:hypothetical protein
LATSRLILRVGDFLTVLTVLIVLAMTPKWMVRPRRAIHGGDRPQHHARSSRPEQPNYRAVATDYARLLKQLIVVVEGRPAAW